MKMIITACRNPAMTRRQFHHHLRHVHWPLIQSLPVVEQALDGYLQNHALGPDSPQAEHSPLRIATGRDSVIELFFDDEAGLARLAAIPEYLAQVRPDEAHFNNLAHNVMVKTAPETLFEAARIGRCKRFDFIARGSSIDGASFVEAMLAQCRDLSLDPLFTGQIDRLVLNVVGEQGERGGFGTGAFDVVVESWAGDFASLAGGGPAPAMLADIDIGRSFTVYATEFVMISPSAAG